MQEVPKRCKIYSLIVLSLASFLLLYLFFAGYEAFWSAILLFGVLTLFAESLGIKLPRVGSISVSSAILFSAIVLFGPLTAAAVAVFTSITFKDIREKTSVYRWVFNGAESVLATGLAGLVYLYAGGHPLLKGGLVSGDFPGILIAFTLSLLGLFALDSLLVSVAIGLYEDVSPASIWLLDCRWTFFNYVTLGVLGIALAEVFVKVGTVGIAFLVVPLLVARQDFEVYMNLQDVYMKTVGSLVTAIEAKDSYTKGHSERVARYAESVARELGWSEDRVQTIRYAALLHDVGKIGIAKKILGKAGKLSEEEFKVVKDHPDLGARIIKEIQFLEDVIPAVIHHHESLDGSGYLEGLVGDSIPLEARIMAVADSYDAMTSARPYRPALNIETAAKELVACSGTQFDQNVVQALLKSLSLERAGERFDTEQEQLPIVENKT
jgi:putative nucleotidyltransferase with HDIG domain